MRSNPLLGALALLALSACPNPVVEVAPDAAGEPPDSGQACAKPCGSSCCTETETCDTSTDTCACEPQCDRRSCGDDGCGGKCGSCPTGTSCNESEGTCYACIPACTGKSCGPDGCGGTCGTCQGTQTCTNGTCTACVPDCNRRSCGADKCGGSCGTCGTGTTCDETAGTCVACTPQCTGKACGGDGCGGTCGSCGTGQICNAANQCVSCAVSCTGKTCGDDGCGGSCGNCGSGQSCNASGQCVGCTAQCTGKACGSDGCGGSCGTCGTGQTCNASGQCVGCTGSCSGKVCGDDGCGGSCGTCGSNQSCNGSGQCVACTPQCSGRVCGTDGCGGSCGTCGAYQTCDGSGHCLACSPQCSGKQCGDNGCGGTCGSCGACDVCSGSGQCVACAPQCSGKTCGDDGCGGLCGVCTSGTCTAGKCVVCTAGQKRCSAKGTALETCSSDGTAWTSSPCSNPGRCDPTSLACVASTCSPGARQCKDGLVVQECNAAGTAFVDKDCRTLDAYATAAATCAGGDCVDPCGAAARSGSTHGCEFWAAVTSSSQLDSSFKGAVTDGTQGDAVSDFALVFTNPNASVATVKITRMKGGAEQVAPSNPTADGAGAVYVAANGSRTVYLPWQAVGATGQQPFAYHVTANVPVAAYQFNPLDAFTGSSKTLDTNGQCTNCSYTSDASMLIPAAGLTGSYVVAGQEHLVLKGDPAAFCTSDADCPGDGNTCSTPLFGTCTFAPTYQVPGFFAIVAAEANTKVTIRFSAATVASVNGTPVGAQAIGSKASYTLARYDVLQFWTAADGGTPQCYTFPTGASFTEVCKYASDPTGTVITAVDATDATQPRRIGVFSGADCSFTPYNQWACDHMEEMLLPVATWGKTYVGAHSPAYCTTSTSGRCTAPVSAPAPDVWRVVSGCTKASCPNGTKVLVDPAPAGALACGAASYTLPPIDVAGGKPTASWVEFEHEGDFMLTADQPVMLAQYLTGESANTGAVEGDPSLVLQAPVEQWRSGLDVLASPTLIHNYLSLVAPAAASTLTVDGKAVNATNFPGLQSSAVGASFTVHRIPVAAGPHSVSASAPIGATVIGYDSYISYGYLGGADLAKINPLTP